MTGRKPNKPLEYLVQTAPEADELITTRMTFVEIVDADFPQYVMMLLNRPGFEHVTLRINGATIKVWAPGQEDQE